MAKLLPPYIDRSCKSPAEKKLFEIFKHSAFTKNWTILHSLNLSSHIKRLYGEIDFLILIPHGGMYVIEVKGGDVKCKNGIWYFTNKFNETHTSNIGPFNQARDAMFSLLNSLEKKFGKGHKLTKVLTGFICAFPQIRFDRHCVEYEGWQILDKDSIEFGLEFFFIDLIRESIEKHKRQPWFSQSSSLPDEDTIRQLADFLRGDFERLRTEKDKLDDFNSQVRNYTEEQYRVLDHIQFNERNLIQGSAGTGKTMIAIESAVRAAQQGKKVFLTCFNRLIGEWMQKQLAEYKDNITVSSLHSFLFDQSKGFDYDRSQSDRQDFFSKYLPQLLKEIYDRGISEKFDKLIVDEGQDLIRDEYLRLFDSMLLKGLSDGEWEIYGDFERQSIFNQLSKEEMFLLLRGYAKPSNFLLQRNCRNTKQIGEETALISGFPSPPFLLEHLEGLPVEYAFYTDQQHQAKLVENTLRRLSNNQIPLNEFIILSPKRIENSCVALITGMKIIDLKHYDDLYAGQTYYGFATIQSYKGMESNYVLLTDVDDFNNAKSKSLLYVGMSRAKYGLIIFVAESARSQYREILKNKIS